MVKETARKCSHCGHNGQNSRSCNGKGGCFRLFGVNIAAMDKQEGFMRKCSSMGNLQSHADNNNVAAVHDDGYSSDGQIHSRENKAAHERKRGKPWTEEEHRIFLAGLRKLGKGDWRGISKNFVTTRTPTQVASHAQKYFKRQAGNDKKKRRPSLFDMDFPELESNASPPVSPLKETTGNPSQVVSRFPQLCLDDRPTYYHRILQPMAHNGLGFPEPQMVQSLPLLQAMNYAEQHYGYMAKALGKEPICSAAPHPSGIPPPKPVLQSLFPAGPGASSAEKDALELKIRPPEPSENTSLPSQASISVI